MTTNYKLRLVDGNHAFVAKIETGWGGWEAPANLEEVYNYRHHNSKGFKLYRTLDHSTCFSFTKTTTGELLHWNRRSKSGLLPERVLPENVEALEGELGIESISEFYDRVTADPTVEYLEIDLAEYEYLPDIEDSEDGAALPEGCKWETFVDYLPFGAAWHGYLPGVLSGVRESVAQACDKALKCEPDVKIWTHKAREGGVHGNRDVGVSASLPSRFTLRSSVSMSFFFPVGDVIRGKSLADAVRKHDALVDEIVNAIRTPIKLVNEYAKGANE